MEEDDAGFLGAARENDYLLAMLLVRLSRSDASISCRPPPEFSKPLTPSPSTGAEDVLAAPPHLPPMPAWGRQRARSAPVSAEGTPEAKRHEDAGRASPATPLSWSGASGASGSGSDDGWPAMVRLPEERTRRSVPQADGKRGREVLGEQIQASSTPELCEKGGPEGVPAGKWAKVGSSDEDGGAHEASVVGATAAVGSPNGSGSTKATAVMAGATRVLGPPRSVRHAGPLRSRLTAQGANSVVLGRHAKKKTVLELRAMEESLLREQEQLRKELGKQREVYNGLIEENVALKKLESSLPPLMGSKRTVTLVCGVAKPEEPQHMQSALDWHAMEGVDTAYVIQDESIPEEPHRAGPFCPVPARTFLFDLNCLPDGDL